MIKTFPAEIVGENVKLVKLAPKFDNAKIVFDIIVNNRDEFRPWLEWVDFVQKPEDEMPVLEGDKDSAEWFIEWNEKIVGRIGFVKLSKGNNYGEVGYWLDKTAGGRGIMTKAFGLLEKNAFENWDFNRIELKIDPENIKSLGVVKRMNFTREGLLRQDHFINGVYRDTFLFSKLKSEYDKSKKL
ncbi:MAG: GNAT family N-acetyltransferase [Alphaproteobacteria bacterium]|nr:GNAT family N-acetyltransferase [Alphaproteobacteria bacterium]